MARHCLAVDNSQNLRVHSFSKHIPLRDVRWWNVARWQARYSHNLFRTSIVLDTIATGHAKHNTIRSARKASEREAAISRRFRVNQHIAVAVVRYRVQRNIKRRFCVQLIFVGFERVIAVRIVVRRACNVSARLPPRIATLAVAIVFVNSQTQRLAAVRNRVWWWHTAHTDGTLAATWVNNAWLAKRFVRTARKRSIRNVIVVRVVARAVVIAAAT